MNLPLIYFDENTHCYTDNRDNKYISVTTLIGKYEEKFEENAEQIARNCEKIGRNPNHAKYEKYKGKSYQQILKEWEKSKIIACDKGNTKHNYLEDVINNANGYKRSNTNHIEGTIYTIDNVLNDPGYGKVNLKYFEKCGLKEKYRTIYDILEYHVKEGYNMYPELGVYSYEDLISGLVDLPLIHYKKKAFKTLDWKSNIDVLSNKAGYYEKDDKGGRTTIFIETNKKLKYPLDYLVDCSSNKYGLQISMYSWLIEKKGLKYEENILCHIRNVLGKDGFETKEELVDVHTMPYMKREVELLVTHNNSNNKKNIQSKLW